MFSGRHPRPLHPAWLVPLALASLLQSDVAAAQTVQTERPSLPSATVAADSGPGALWLNPANLAYDRDPSFGAIFGYELTQAPTAVSASGRLRSMALGVHTVSGTEGSDWSLSYGAGLPLPRRLAVGLRVGWQLLADGRDHASFDLGGSWRPLPWLGASAVARNLGGSSTEPARSGLGIALRPIGEGALIGYQWLRRAPQAGADGQPLQAGDEAMRLAARLRPVEGLFLRGHVESINPDEQDPYVGWGAGIELYFGGVGAGVHGVDPTGETPAMIAVVGTEEPGESLVRPGRRVPVLSLEGRPAYQPSRGPFEPPQRSWLDVLELLRRAGEDRGVRGVLVRLDRTEISWAMAEELRARMLELRQRDKIVIAYLHTAAETRDYFVATAADHVVLHPARSLRILGISTQLMHLRAALDLFGIHPDYVQQGRYKSAPEQFTRYEPSAAEIEAQQAVLDERYATIVQAIARGREVEPDDARAWIDAAPWSAAEALQAGLIDAALYPDELAQLVDRIVPGDVISYDLARRDAEGESPWDARSQVAVLYLQGALVPGRSGAGTTGAATVVAQLEAVLHTPQVRAVVLRIDSPGGSVLAADEIHHAVERLRAAGLPVIASLGGVATSGGYYVACAADRIVAEPTTLTGSIGVYSGKLALREALARVGIHTTTLQRGRVAGLDDLERWDAVERARVEAEAASMYRLFLRRVQEGRDLSPEAVDAAAGGRLWTGARAVELGLVDAPGGLQEAIAMARQRAGLGPKRAVALVSPGPSGRLLESLSPASIQGMREPLLPELQQLGLPPLLELLRLYAALDEPVLYWDPIAWEISSR